MPYYVSHSMPLKRARVHIHSCIYCREGQGQAAQVNRVSSALSNWSLPLSSFLEADSYMRGTFPYADIGNCARCKPDRAQL
jgi:hypothetical protein